MGDVQSVPHILRSTLDRAVHRRARASSTRSAARATGRRSIARGSGRRRRPSRSSTSTSGRRTRAPLAVPAPTGARARRGLEEGRRGHVRRARLRAHVRGVDGRRGRAQGRVRLGRRSHRRCSRRASRSRSPCTSATTPRPRRSPRPTPSPSARSASSSPALKEARQAHRSSDATTICFDRKDLGPLLFARSGREVVMIDGPATRGGRSLDVDEHLRDREEVGGRDRRSQ